MAGTERVSKKEDNQSCTLNTVLSKEMQKTWSSFNSKCLKLLNRNGQWNYRQSITWAQHSPGTINQAGPKRHKIFEACQATLNSQLIPGVPPVCLTQPGRGTCMTCTGAAVRSRNSLLATRQRGWVAVTSLCKLRGMQR